MRQKKPGKIGDFFADKGFYIILILCIAAIGISGYVLFFSGPDKTGGNNLYIGGNGPDSLESEKPAGNTPQETELRTEIPENAIRKTEVVMASPDASPKDNVEAVSGNLPGEVLSESDTSGNPGGSGKAQNDTGSPETSPKPVTASFFVWPVSGELLERFSIDRLVFNETLGDWRVHPGIDIASPLGTQVCAIGDGVVEDVYIDELLGVTVVIDHGNKTRSVYRNLMETVMVSAGDTVYAGDIIGGIGQTAADELLDPPHLHLEVIRDGAQIDPCSLLP